MNCLKIESDFIIRAVGEDANHYQQYGKFKKMFLNRL